MDLLNETYGQYFTDEMKADESMKPYAEMKGVDLINGHKELSGKVATFDTEKQGYETRLASALEPLPENATDQQRADHQAKIRTLTGVPEKATDYQLNLPETVKGDDPLLMAFAAKMHESGANAAQVQAGIDSFIAYANDARKQAREASDAALKTAWGVNYEGNLRKAFSVLEAGYKEIGLPVEAAKGIIDQLRNDAGAVQWLHNLSRHYSEAQLSGGGGSGQAGMTAFDKFAKAVSTKKQ